MSRFSLLLSCLLLGIGASLMGVFLLIEHLPYAHIPLGIGIVAGLLFLGLALTEVLTSSRASGSTKVIWTALLLMSGTVGGLLYLFIGRRSVAAVPEQ